MKIHMNLGRNVLARRLRPTAIVSAIICLFAQGVTAGPDLPQAGTSVFGKTAISTAGSNMTITETTPTAGIDWQSFNIGKGYSVNVVQPGSTSILFNRVTGVDPSQILGNLNSNGMVFLSNANGVYFGKSAVVNVGSLIATSLNYNPLAASSGVISLSEGTVQPGAVVQDGSIHATNGVVLIAPQVNQLGTIDANKIGIASAGAVRVDLAGDGKILFDVTASQYAQKLDVLGRLVANGGGTVDIEAQTKATLTDSVLNLQGIVQAQSFGTRNGQVFIAGGSSGTVQVGGAIDVSGQHAGEIGGHVQVLGQSVHLQSGSTVNADGVVGGGLVEIGGGWMGVGTSTQSQVLAMDQGATVSASALLSGSGGTLVLRSDVANPDGITTIAGSLIATGAVGGKGGMVETSGYQLFLTPSASVAVGRGGEWLLDPIDITITNSSGANKIDVTTLNNALLAGANVTIDTNGATPYLATPTQSAVTTENGTLTTGAPNAASGSITVSRAIDSGVGTGSLTLIASNAINVNQSITLGSGDLTMSAAAGGITQANPAAITIGGTATLKANGAITLNSTLAAPTVNITAYNGLGSPKTIGLGGATGTYNLTIDDASLANIIASTALNIGDSNTGTVGIGTIAPVNNTVITSGSGGIIQDGGTGITLSGTSGRNITLTTLK